MTDPALIGHLRILEAKLDRLTEAINRVAVALERQDGQQLDHIYDVLKEIALNIEALP